METKRIIDNRFEIIRKLGEGGTAQVFLAFDHKHEQNIALKVLKSDLVTEQKIRYFNREAQAISMLNNEYVIKIYDWGHDSLNNVHFIAQEYVEGMTIKEYLKLSSNLAVTEVVSIIEKILDGLAHAHLNGVIHKDIKGQNILIDVDKNIKITDFGIADILEDETTKTQSLMGTPQYVAPETLNRNISNAQTDIYSVGILMYELLCGQAPFTGDKPAVIMMKQINQPLPSIRMQRSDVPQALENIVIKATAKRLENRYLSSEEMLFDLATVFESYNDDVPKLVLENDLMDNEEIEQTIQIDSTLRIDNMKKEIDKSKKRQTQRRKILIALLVLVPVIILLVLLLKPSTYIMPPLIGKNLDDAKTSLIISGIDEKYIVEEYASSDEVPVGQVMLTEPEEGAEVGPEDKITLTVSQGPETEVVGNYVGQDGDTVKAELENLGFTVEVSTDYSDQPEGTIYQQEPASGTEIEHNGTIKLFVSTGSAPVKIENFIGLSEESALAFVTENGLISTSNYECSDEIDKDKVITQNPSSGAMLEVGGAIEFTVSSGVCEELTLEPSETGSEEETSDTTDDTDTKTDDTKTDDTKADEESAN